MLHQTTAATAPSSVTWESLETFVRQQAQPWVQRLLEEEVTEAVGRLKSQRRVTVDGAAGYRNGYGKPRQLTLLGGTMEVRRPRVRGLSERFVSRVLPLFKRHSAEVGRLLPELYLHGLSSGDFDRALRGLLGEGASLSARSVDRLKAAWQAEYEAWRQRPLGELEVVYRWASGGRWRGSIRRRRNSVAGTIGSSTCSIGCRGRRKR